MKATKVKFVTNTKQKTNIDQTLAKIFQNMEKRRLTLKGFLKACFESNDSDLEEEETRWGTRLRLYHLKALQNAYQWPKSKPPSLVSGELFQYNHFFFFFSNAVLIPTLCMLKCFLVHNAALHLVHNLIAH
ncbi:hypothetical protein BCR41DRAFT_374092 [Lobosporangium transversale]|uniref:Uncharacterized protein n=1 Tax=Lobosporangium transversale TaxID=64571 RepID=A0A1Y2GBN3_9FUNG|nr:hypothetical protein BCR41DRAFT_374092 [Lobosporangium transversale]ORZ06371.1 hypothetical protein BCR41DRAFT_374092 [Lobosporangium transversale]|eukprot:XP_021877534.1 hypothetical protein BCR41DRAFT_374092 [Lobosporangium transversale]